MSIAYQTDPQHQTPASRKAYAMTTLTTGSLRSQSTGMSGPVSFLTAAAIAFAVLALLWNVAHFYPAVAILAAAAYGPSFMGYGSVMVVAAVVAGSAALVIHSLQKR